MNVLERLKVAFSITHLPEVEPAPETVNVVVVQPSEFAQNDARFLLLEDFQRTARVELDRINARLGLTSPVVHDPKVHGPYPGGVLKSVDA